MRGLVIFGGVLLLGVTLFAQDADPGRVVFDARCSRCHGGDGRGADGGPAIVARLSALADPQLSTLVHDGLPARGMPANLVSDAETAPLIRFLRTLQPRVVAPAERRTVSMIDGKTLEGVLVNEGITELQLRTNDSHVHLLRAAAGGKYREVTSQADWPGYNGAPGGNRFITFDQITPSNVSRLGPKWFFPVPNATRLQLTPSVVGGIMYVPGGTDCFALDAGSGREIWHYQSAASRQAQPGRANGTNRGLAVAGDRVFLISERNHLIALNRFTGELLWDTTTSDPRLNYFATSAPLAVGNLVVSGLSGGEHGARGFLAAYDQTTGKEAWRFWTTPAAGEPNAETWQGNNLDHAGAPTWFTGTFDEASDTVYWPTGNPSAEYYGENRLGDNLYSDCVLALDAKTGKLKWYYQFTPHDQWDWDATETPMLVDATWQGQPRKLLLQGNRNGFFYVFDRTDGKLLLAKPFVRNLTWASGIGADGRPIRNPNQDPTPAGTKVCPSQDGATNWFSPSFNPATGLFYLQTFEKCSIYTRTTPGEWQSGKQYLGGSQRVAPEAMDGKTKPERFLKALDFRTGEVVWEVPQPGPATSWGGTIATSTGLVIFGEESGSLVASDAATGKILWSFPTNQPWHTSPMAYMFDGKEYIAIATNTGIMSFGLSE